MNINLKKLEFDKIINILITFCVTSKGKEIATELLPSNNYNKVQDMLEETKEAVSLMYRNSCPSFYEFQDIDLSIKNLKSGISLSANAILNLNKIFKMSFDLKNYFDKEYIEDSEYPILSNLFNESSLNSDLNLLKYCFNSLIHNSLCLKEPKLLIFKITLSLKLKIFNISLANNNISTSLKKDLTFKNSTPY